MKCVFNIIPQAGFCLYKLPDGDQEGCLDSEEYKISQGIPPNTAVNVLIRVYVVAVSFHLILSETLICCTIHLQSKLMYFCMSNFQYKTPFGLFLSHTVHMVLLHSLIITACNILFLQINLAVEIHSALMFLTNI